MQVFLVKIHAFFTKNSVVLNAAKIQLMTLKAFK